MPAPERLPEPGDPRAVYVVDLHHFVWRHVAAVGMRGAESFVRWFCRLVEQRRPAYLICADDAPGGSFRADVLREAGYVGDDAYKGNRRKLRDEDLAVLADQRDEIRTFVEDLGVPVVAVPGFEADDVVATLVEIAAGRRWCFCQECGVSAPRELIDFWTTARSRARGAVERGWVCALKPGGHRDYYRGREERGGDVVVVSCDHDLLQLVGERPSGGTCVVWDGAFDVRGPEGCRRALGVVPERVPDFFAVVGGKNNVPGVPKLGAVRAAALLRDRGLDELLPALEACAEVAEIGAQLPGGAKPQVGLDLRAGADVARLGLRLTRLRGDVPLDLAHIFSLARRA